MINKPSLFSLADYGLTMDDIAVPLKTAFKIGSLEVQMYGILFTIGFVFAILAASLKLAKWYKVSYIPFYWFVFIGIPVSLLGARLWSFIIGDAATALETSNFFVAFWNFRSGGLAIQGGVLFTVIAALIYFPIILKKPQYHVKTKFGNEMYVKQVSMWVYADAIIPCILIGQIIGRWGNFTNQEVYGPIVTPENIHTMDWLKNFMPAVWKGMFIKDDSYNFHQPFFLYESFINFWFFIALYVGAEFIKKRKAGDIGIAYFILYGILRLCMEPFRSGDFKFSFSIVTSSLFIVIGIVLIALNHLVFCKMRNFRYIDYLWDTTKNKIKKENRTINRNIYVKNDNEVFYYNGY